MIRRFKTTPVIRAEQLRTLGTMIFVAVGATADEAKLVSELLVKSNLVGHDSHGILRIIQYVRQIREGSLKPSAKIEIVRDMPMSVLINGNWGFGQVIAKRAMSIAIDKAEKSGVGIACAFNCNHIGRLADYTLMASSKGLVGMALINSMKGVAPFGGMERKVSTDPLSFAFPTDEEIPFVLDIATSMAAEGKLRFSRAKGEKVPEGWIIDKDGNPTQEPADFYDGGCILPLGGDSVGHKGFGLALTVEVLGGILAQSKCAYETDKAGNGIFFEAIKIENFMPLAEFKKQMDNLIHSVKTSKVRPGFKEILMPGEPEYRTEQKRLKEGIYVPEKNWQDLTELANELKIDISKVESNVL